MTKITRNSYHCTPTSKFASDGIPTDLAEKVASRLKPIEYDRWSDLHWKAQLEGALSAAGEHELARLEDENMETIEKVYQRLRNDKKVQAHIMKIKEHPWVQVVEKKNNV